MTATDVKHDCFHHVLTLAADGRSPEDGAHDTLTERAGFRLSCISVRAKLASCPARARFRADFGHNFRRKWVFPVCVSVPCPIASKSYKHLIARSRQALRLSVPGIIIDAAALPNILTYSTYVVLSCLSYPRRLGRNTHMHHAHALRAPKAASGMPAASRQTSPFCAPLIAV